MLVLVWCIHRLTRWHLGGSPFVLVIFGTGVVLVFTDVVLVLMWHRVAEVLKAVHESFGRSPKIGKD